MKINSSCITHLLIVCVCVCVSELNSILSLQMICYWGLDQGYTSAPALNITVSLWNMTHVLRGSPDALSPMCV